MRFFSGWQHQQPCRHTLVLIAWKKTSWYRNIIILLGVEEHPKFHEKFRENDLGGLNKLSNFAPACTDSTQHTVAAAPYFFSMRFPWKWRLIEWSIVCVHKKLNSTRGNICRLETRKKNQMKMMATILEGHKPNKTSTNKHLYLVPTSTHLQTLIFYRNYTYLHTYIFEFDEMS